MSTQKTCPQCGTVFDASLSGCASCQIKMGLRTGTGSIDANQFNGPQISVEELSAKFTDLEILEVIGMGGMGAVYRVRQKKLDRVVALKIIRPDISDSGEFLQRFEREAKAMARLNHPNIVSIYDFGTKDGVCYYLMELVDGPDLAELCSSESLSPCESLEIVTQVCRAIQYAHDHGVVHRDIKPTNILLNREGAVKIADFGLAKLCLPDDATTQLTQTQQVFGTPRYMAPEQIEAAKEVDHRADIYSLGVVFYELLTGELPLGRFDPPSQKIQVDVRLDDVVLRALEKHPERRYQAAHEFQTDISQLVQPVAPVKGAGLRQQTTQLPQAVSDSLSRRAPWQLLPLFIPGAIITAIGVFLIFAHWALFLFQVEYLYFSHPSTIPLALSSLVTGAILLLGGCVLWYRSLSPQQENALRSISPVRRVLNYRVLIYLALACTLVSIAFPWMELASPAKLGESWLSLAGSDSYYVFGFQSWAGKAIGILTLLVLPMLIFIDIYEGQRVYFSITQFGFGVIVAVAAIGVMQTEPRLLISRSESFFDSGMLATNRAPDSVAINALAFCGHFIAVTAVLRLIWLGIAHVFSQPMRESTGQVVSQSGSTLVKWARDLVEWIRKQSQRENDDRM